MTDVYIEEELYPVISVAHYFYMCTVILSAVSIVFGIVSWISIPKWRQFQHYVLLSLLFTIHLQEIRKLMLHPYFILDEWQTVRHLTIIYCFLTLIHWLMIATVMFYVDFVKVFTTLKELKHIYLYVNVFGWILPLLTASAEVYFEGEIGLYITFILLVINLILYLIVLFELCKPPRVPEPRPNIGKKILLSTFTFIITGILLFVPDLTLSIITIVNKDNTLLFNKMCIAYLFSYSITLLCVNVFFLILKTHRVLWIEQWQRVRNNRM